MYVSKGIKMIEKLIQKCEKCGWVMPLNNKKTLVCAKCGHCNNAKKKLNLKLNEVDLAFKKEERN